MHKLGKSFKYALEGIVYAIVTERNMRIHFVIALAVMVLSLLLGVNRWEALLLFVAITFVIIAELFNTAIESLVDIATDTYHPLAKIAKDVAAGAVFLSAGLALTIGAVVFLPHFFSLVQHKFMEKWFDPGTGAVFVLGMVLFTTIMLKALAYKNSQLVPSLTTSLTVSITLLVWWMTWQIVVSVLVTGLSTLFIISRLRYGPWLPVAWGTLVGVVVTCIGILLI